MITGEIDADVDVGLPGASLSNAAKNNERQYGVVYDLLCAGPINGVVGGLSGIYLNDTPLVDHETYKKVRMKYRINASINASTGVITATNIFKDVDLANGARFIQMVTSDGGATPGGISTTLATGMAKDSRSVTAASSVFTLPMSLNYNQIRTAYLSDHIGFKIRIDGAGPDGKQYNGIITRVSNPAGSGSGAVIFPAIDTAVNSGANVYIDKFFAVSSITNANSGVLANYTGSNATNVSCIVSQASQFYNDTSSNLNYDNAFAHVKTGTRYQTPIEAAQGYGDAPSASYMISPNSSLTWYAGTGGQFLSPGPSNTSSGARATASATFINASQFNLAQNVKSEIDRVNITIGFPSGLRYISPKGNDGPAAVEFQVILRYKQDSSETTFQTKLIHGRDYGGTNFIDGVVQTNGDSTTKSNTYSWIAVDSDFDHQDKIDDYFGNYGQASRRHAGTVVRRAQSAAFTHEFPVTLSDLQPLHDWQIEIRRLTPDNPIHWNPVEIDGMNAQLFASCNVQSVEAQILDKFTYPTSAYGVVSYSAEDFSTPPKRSYKIQGRKIKVPSNYITREEGRSNEAQYCRNVTTGAKVVDGSGNGVYQAWNGAFRGDESLSATHANFKKVYTNNPAWIFYDVLTDKEIGLGEYIQESDIDKYALYQIGRYCDELVPNGKGGMEPRFSCNVYIKSQAEAYKVLKDLASTFRAMMYWIDGEIVAVQDSPKEPVYNFTTGNVEDGIFNYTYTSQRTRTNQINVTWINPLELYKRTVLTVEDTQHIESVGRVIPSDIVAFGCTSEGQARRLADWHLSTAKNENEIVTFTSGINAAFLRPGDIINVQDKRRYGFEASGRVSSGSTTSSINLDRTVSAPGGGNLNGCNLYLIFTEPGIYLAQDSATINSVAYVRGQLLLENASGGAIATQEQAANLLDDSNNPVITHFSESSRVEVKAITTNASSGSAISVSGAFSSAPQQDTVWAISRKDDINTDDLQEYRILSIGEDEKEKYTISASLYSKDKYDEIDAEVPIVTNDYIPRPRVGDAVPAPTGLSFEQLPSSTISKDGTGTTVSVVASWTAPVETYRDSNDTATSISYRFLSHFEIQHTFPSVNNTAQGSNWSKIRDINGNANTITFSNVDAGTYTMRIRAVNTEGAHSPWNEITREIFSIPPGTSRIARVPRGGFLTFSPEINASTGLISIDATAYRYIHPSGEQYVFNPASTTQLQQSFSTLPAGQTAFWVFNASGTSDPWLAMQLHTDTVATDATGNPTNFNYLKEIGVSNNGLNAASGTVSVTAGSTEVTGSGTSFASDFAVGRFIKISDNSAPGTQVANSEYREIVEIESNTKLTVRNPFTRTFANKTAMHQISAIDFREDAILAEVTRASSGASPYSAEFFVQGKGAGGSDTVKTVHVFRSGTLPVEVPDPTTAEVGRDFVEDDFVLIHYTDKSVALIYDGTGWGEEAEYFDAGLIRENTLPQDSIEEEETFDKIHRLKNVYDAVNQSAPTGRGEITFRNSADNANVTAWSQVGKIKISSVDSENRDKTSKLSKITQRTHIHIVEDVSDSAQDSGTVPSKAVYKAAASSAVSTTTTSATITSVGSKSVRVNLSQANTAIKVGDTFTTTGISFFFAQPKVRYVQMSSTPYYVLLTTSVPKFSGSRIGTFTRKQHTITVGSPITETGSINYSSNYIVKLQVQSPSEVTTGETLVVGSVTGDALAAATVTGAKIAGSTIQAANIVDGTITGTKIASATILDSNIVNGTITGTSIDNATITGSNMVNGTITGTKIDAATITGSNMVNGTITGTKIDSATITGSNIDSATITGSNIDSATITGSNIANTTITGGKIAGTTITGSNLVNGTITGTQIANASIAGGKIAGATITDANIASGTITGTRIASSTISNGLLVDNTIQGGKIALATIQGGNIATNTITANNITVTSLSSLSANIGAISSGSLQGGTVPDANGAPSGSETGSFFDLTLGRFVVGNASKYVLWNGTSLVIGGDVIASGNIQANAVTQAKIASAAVGANEIAALAVERAKIADNAINANKIASNAITATEIAANTITASELTTGSFVTNTANISNGIITSAKIDSLDADKITANTTFSNNLTVGSTFTMNSSGKMYSSGKTDYGNATAGFFLGYSGGAYKFHLGNNTNYVKWDGSTLSINGTLNITASEVSGLSDAATTSVSSIRSGTTKANVGLGNLNNPSSAVTPIAAGDVNGNVTSISGGAITTGTVSAARIDVGSITIGSLSGTAAQKRSAIGAGTVNPSDVNGNVTSISGGVITTGTINGNNVNVTNINASNISAGTLSADRIAANSISLTKINDVLFTAGANGNLGLGTLVMDSINTSGDQPFGNLGLGYATLTDLTGGDFNTCLGFASGVDITSGDGNVGVGQSSMYRHSSGSYNTYIGTKAGFGNGDNNGNSNYNVLLGYNTSSATGSTQGLLGYSIGIGSFAQASFKGAIAIGYDAYASRTYSIAIGYSSESTGSTQFTNQGNVLLGSNIHATGSGHILIGCASGTRTDANTVRIGTGSHTTVLIGDGDVASASDSRDKIDIKDISLGLNLVKTLSAKSFIYNHRENYVNHTVIDNVIDETLTSTFTIEDTPAEGTLYVKHNLNTLELGTDYTFSNKTITLKDTISLEKGDDVQVRYDTFDTAGYESASKKHPHRTLGWVAQEAKTAVENLTSEELNIVNSEDEEYLKFSPMQLIPVLWKAVQELSDKNDALEARIATLEGG